MKSAYLLFMFLLHTYSLVFTASVSAKAVLPSQVGAAQIDSYLPQIQNKSIGLVVNQTSMIQNRHLVDVLRDNGINIKYIFAPEHGFRGNKGAGEFVESGNDKKTGIPVVSIYGKSKRPPAAIMSQLDVVIFDIQDVGARFYTYVSSMHYMMQAAALNQVEFIVLDRPNPNIQFIDGPVLEDKFRSFVGIHPIPVLHGMTVGELAQMIKGENWLSIRAPEEVKDSEKLNNLQLTIVPVKNYNRSDTYSLPVPPSPNLPNDKAIQLYAALCFFEATPVSIGRGTEFPFQVIGHNQVFTGEFQFMPVVMPYAAPYPKLKNQITTGIDLRKSDIEGLDLKAFYSWFSLFRQRGVVFFERAAFMDKLAGTNKLRLAMLAGQPLIQIEKNWQVGIEKFKKQRLPYLIYQ